VHLVEVGDYCDLLVRGGGTGRSGSGGSGRAGVVKWVECRRCRGSILSDVGVLGEGARRRRGNFEFRIQNLGLGVRNWEASGGWWGVRFGSRWWMGWYFGVWGL